MRLTKERWTLGRQAVWVVLALGLLGVVGAAADPVADKLAAQYLKLGIEFRIPKAMAAVPVVPTSDARYEAAFRYPDNPRYELRFQVFPSTYYSTEKNPTIEALKNKMYTTSVATGFAIAGSSTIKPNVGFFDANAVYLEFGADLGSTNTVAGNSKFATGYKVVMIVSLSRKARNVVVVYHLFSDFAEFKRFTASSRFDEAFHSVAFGT